MLVHFEICFLYYILYYIMYHACSVYQCGVNFDISNHITRARVNWTIMKFQYLFRNKKLPECTGLNHYSLYNKQEATRPKQYSL